MDLRKAKKLAILQTEPNLVFFDEIQSLKNKLKGIQGFLSEINTKEVKNYEEELKTLLDAISGLTESVDSKDMVVNIPLDNLTTSIERVESAIKAIKEVKIPEFPKEMSLTDTQINEILLAIQSIPEFPVSELKMMVYGIEKAIREINIEKEEFDYDFLRTKFDGLIKAIKNISITVASGGNGFPEALTSTNTHTGNREVRVYQENHICTDNTTTTPLGSNETFTGQWQDHLQYQEINISIDTDKDSAVNGLVIEWSADGTTVADTDSFSVYANSGTNYTPNPAFRYVRIKYTNGATPQTRFSLMTILRRGATGGSFHRIDSTLRDDSDARLNITVPKLKTAANTYVSQTATTAGNAKMSLEELETGISDNNKSQLKVSMYGKTGDATFQVPRIDPTTHSLQCIDYPHREIHSGDHYFYSDCLTLASAATQDYLITTPDTTKWTHLSFFFSGSAITAMDVYEAGNRVGTTSQTIFNNNRNSPNTSGNTLHKGTSGGTTDGTKIWCHKSGSATGAASSVGVSSEQNSEIVLKQNTKYLFRITSGTVDNLVNFRLGWYEHQNRQS